MSERRGTRTSDTSTTQAATVWRVWSTTRRQPQHDQSNINFDAASSCLGQRVGNAEDVARTGGEVRGKIIGRWERGICNVAVVVVVVANVPPVTRCLIPTVHQARRLKLRHLPAPEEHLDRAGISCICRDKDGVPEDDVCQPVRVDGCGVD